MVFLGQMVDYGRVSKPCSSPSHFLSDRLLVERFVCPNTSANYEKLKEG
jgi:hypothetical protein